MKVNISQVKKELGTSHSFHFITTPQKLNIDCSRFSEESSILVSGEVANVGDRLVISGSIEADAHYECDRCLKAYTVREKIAFEEHYREMVAELAQSETEEDFTYQGDEVDISELVREHLLMTEPLQALCHPSCKGLCPVCGVNKNTTLCECQNTEMDPRLAVLSQLKSKE